MQCASKARDSLVPLSVLEVGESAVLAQVLGGKGLKRRLMSMGLNPGVVVRMVQNTMFGPIILGILDTRLALGRAMAQQIFVRRP